jgi:hypothetical protein
MSPTQALMNLAFNAQNQSRATLQELFDLKQLRKLTVIKQANISQGHQQVNNLAKKIKFHKTNYWKVKSMTWTLGRREKQREMILRRNPWENSTGVRTVQGKAKVTKNRIKTGISLKIREFFKNLKSPLKTQKDLIRCKVN